MTTSPCDIYQIEGSEDIQHFYGADMARVLHRTTAIVFKPDVLVRRQVHPALDILNDHRFRPAAFARFPFNRNIVREMWRGRPDGPPHALVRDVIDLYMASGPSLFVLLQLDAPSEEPAADRLRHLKGPALMDQRRPEHLRTRIGSPSSVLSLVHTPDDAIAFVREFAMLFGHRDRVELLRQAASPLQPSVLRDEVDQLYSLYPAHDLRIDEPLERLCSAALGQNGRGAAVVAACARLRAAEPIDWPLLVETAAAIGMEMPLWDQVVIGSACVEHLCHRAAGAPVA